MTKFHELSEQPSYVLVDYHFMVLYSRLIIAKREREGERERESEKVFLLHSVTS